MGNNFRNALTFSSGSFAARWNEVCNEFGQSEAAWIANLRASGIKAAHPDDGWVNRERNTVQFVYPQFNDGAAVGDLVALGYHFDKTRIVKLVGCERMLLGSVQWKFEEQAS